MNALVRRLEKQLNLTPAERDALTAATADGVRFSPRADIVVEGERPEAANVLLTGFACRYKMLEDGRRQIVALLVPGDVSDLYGFVLDRTDHALAALTDVTVAQLRPEVVDELAQHHLGLRRAFWWAKLVDEAITREWVMNTGQRTALERTAHLFCELFWRLRSVGLTRDGACELPLTQTELADTLGMSAVHVNRTLQEMRREGLVVLRERELTLPDLERLQSVALFHPGYLHLRGADPEAARAERRFG